MTGYWERDLAAPRSTGWRFHETGGPLLGDRLRNPAADTSATGLGPSENGRYVMRSGGVHAVLENFNVYCSPARLTITEGNRTRKMLLHSVDGLRQQARARGLDLDPRVQYGAIEDRTGGIEEVTVRATSEEIVIPERNCTFRRDPGR